MHRHITGLAAGVLLLAGASAAAQSRFEIGAQMVVADSSALEEADTGIGLRIGYSPKPLVGVEAELDLYPSDYPSRVPISGSRLGVLFGMTLGPQIGPVRPFLRVRPGFLKFQEAPNPVACIQTFPPQLSCLLAVGGTYVTVDVGAGVSIDTPGRTFIRVDAGDRVIRYPGPSVGSQLKAAFTSHDLRVALGAGLRF